MPCKNSATRTTRLNQSSNARISCETCTCLARASLARDMHASTNGLSTQPSRAVQTGVRIHPIQASTINHIMQLLWTSQKMRLRPVMTHPDARKTMDAHIFQQKRCARQMYAPGLGSRILRCSPNLMHVCNILHVPI